MVGLENKCNNKIYRNMKMKYHLFLFLIIGFLLQACNDDTSQVVPERNELKLTASAETIVLDKDKEAETVLTFSWNKATDIGSEYTFSYLFQIDIADNNFATATDYVVLAENESYSFTAGQLYDFIVEEWGMTAGQPVYIEARVAAKVDGPKFVYPEIAMTKVLITTFIPDSKPLYMLGTATTAGMDPLKAILMTEVSNGRLYEWNGKLEAGSLKFITTLGSMLPSYNRGEDNLSLVERTDENEPDDYFEIKEAGSYYIKLSLKNKTVSFQQSKFEALYIVGDGCDAGWSFNTRMEQDKVNLNIFTYLGDLKTGGESAFKIIAGTNWEDPTFRPLVADAPIENGKVQLTTTGADLKWKVTTDKAGKYLVTLDVDELEITFEKQ